MEQLISELNLPSFLGDPSIDVGNIDLDDLDLDLSSIYSSGDERPVLLGHVSAHSWAHAPPMRQNQTITKQDTLQQRVTTQATMSVRQSAGAITADTTQNASRVSNKNQSALQQQSHLASTLLHAGEDATADDGDDYSSLAFSRSTLSVRSLHDTSAQNVMRGYHADGADADAAADIQPESKEQAQAAPVAEVDPALKVVPRTPSRDAASRNYETESKLNEILPTSLATADVVRVRNALSAVAIAYRQSELLLEHANQEADHERRLRQDAVTLQLAAQAETKAQHERVGFLTHLFDRVADELQQSGTQPAWLSASSAVKPELDISAISPVEDDGSFHSLASRAERISNGSKLAYTALPSLNLLRGEALHAAQNRITALEARVMQLEDHNSMLEHKWDFRNAVQSTGFLALKREVMSLNAQLASGAALIGAKLRDAKASTEKLTSESSAISAHSVHLQHHCNHLEDQNKQLEIALTQRAEECTKASAQLRLAEEAIMILKQELQARDATISDMGAELARCQQEVAAEKARVSGMPAAHGTADGAFSVAALLHGSPTAVAAAPSERELLDHLVHLESQVTQLTSALGELQQGKSPSPPPDNEDALLSALVEEQRHEIASLRDQVQSLLTHPEAEAEPSTFFGGYDLNASSGSVLLDAASVTFDDLRGHVARLRTELLRERSTYDSRLQQRERALRLEYEAQLALLRYGGPATRAFHGRVAAATHNDAAADVHPDHKPPTVQFAAASESSLVEGGAAMCNTTSPEVQETPTTAAPLNQWVSDFADTEWLDLSTSEITRAT